jgi:hypothetical protein
MSARSLAVALAEWHIGLADVSLHFTDGPGGAELLARRAVEQGRVDIVVAAGGDGTVGEVATALAHTDVPLGIIPAGSTNIIAKELGIPGDPWAALDVIAGDHRQMAMDLGIANGRAMLHMAGAGFDSRLFAMTDPKLKRLGRLRPGRHPGLPRPPPSSEDHDRLRDLSAGVPARPGRQRRRDHSSRPADRRAPHRL